MALTWPQLEVVKKIGICSQYCYNSQLWWGSCSVILKMSNCRFCMSFISCLYSLLALSFLLFLTLFRQCLLGSLLHLDHTGRCSLDDILLIPDGESAGKLNHSLSPLSSVGQSFDGLLKRRRQKVTLLGESEEADQEGSDDSLYLKSVL